MKPKRPVRTLSLLLAATAAALVAVTPAYAGQVVFDRGADLYVMNDDGSGARALATSSQVPTTDDIFYPSTGPTGTRVVFSALRSDGDPVACGSNCVSVWLLDEGSLRRLSATPGRTGGNVATYSNDPELSFDGAFTFFTNSVNTLSPSRLESELAVYQNSDGAAADLDTGCSDARNPAPRPDASDEVVYACAANRRLYRTGADPQVAGDDVPIVSDDATPRDPSFSADGNTIVDAEGGGEPGLWTISYDGTLIAHLLDSAGTELSSPRFAGGRVLFVADRNIWSVPTACAVPACTFPASATQLTTSGDVGAIGWTSSTTPIKPLTIAPPPTTTTTTTPTTTTTTTTTTPPVAPTVTGFSLTGTAKKLKAALKAGVKVRAGCDKPCDLGGKAFIDAKTAKRYGLGKKRIAVASGRKAGVTSTTSLTLKFTAKAKKKLAKAKTLKLAVELTATAGGPSSTKKGSLTLKK